MGEQVTKVSQKRGGRLITAHKARSFAEAEKWDLDYWLARTPKIRLEALEIIRRERGLIRRDRD